MAAIALLNTCFGPAWRPAAAAAQQQRLHHSISEPLTTPAAPRWQPFHCHIQLSCPPHHNKKPFVTPLWSITDEVDSLVELAVKSINESVFLIIKSLLICFFVRFLFFRLSTSCSKRKAFATKLIMWPIHLTRLLSESRMSERRA
jgi:hypothetical protein